MSLRSLAADLEQPALPLDIDFDQAPFHQIPEFLWIGRVDPSEGVPDTHKVELHIVEQLCRRSVFELVPVACSNGIARGPIGVEVDLENPPFEDRFDFRAPGVEVHCRESAHPVLVGLDCIGVREVGLDQPPPLLQRLLCQAHVLRAFVAVDIHSHRHDAVVLHLNRFGHRLLCLLNRRILPMAQSCHAEDPDNDEEGGGDRCNRLHRNTPLGNGLL